LIFIVSLFCLVLILLGFDEPLGNALEKELGHGELAKQLQFVEGIENG
jgi:hypothetical protein